MTKTIDEILLLVDEYADNPYREGTDSNTKHTGIARAAVVAALRGALTERKPNDDEAMQGFLTNLAKDAERYRWLREQDWFDGDLCVLRSPKRILINGYGLGADCPSRERLDTAIDAAMKETL